MKKGKTIYDYVSGGCLIVNELNKFLDYWCCTENNPCTLCDIDRSECNFYKVHVSSDILHSSQHCENSVGVPEGFTRID
jgi:hypothetical protein